MLPRRNRLRKSFDIKRIRQHGQSWRHPLAILLVLSNDQEVSRFAFVASRHIGNAVTRNRTKRVLREVVRCHLNEIESGWDCLIIARNKIPRAPYIKVESAVLQLLSRANLLSKDAN